MQRARPILTAAFLLCGCAGALAQVNFGDNVRIGGHDFSNRSYSGVRVEMTSESPPWLGCRIFDAGETHEGRRLTERTEICYLEQIPEDEREMPR